MSKKRANISLIPRKEPLKVNLKKVQAKQALRESTTFALVAGINNILTILQERDVKIKDWDDEGRELFQIKMLKEDRIYFLAMEKESEENCD